MGDQVTPGSICLTFAAQFLSLGESYLACDLGVGCAGERVSNVQFSMSGVKVIVMSCNTDSHTGNKGRKTHFPFTFAKEVTNLHTENAVMFIVDKKKPKKSDY